MKEASQSDLPEAVAVAANRILNYDAESSPQFLSPHTSTTS